MLHPVRGAANPGAQVLTSEAIDTSTPPFDPPATRAGDPPFVSYARA